MWLSVKVYVCMSPALSVMKLYWGLNLGPCPVQTLLSSINTSGQLSEFSFIGLDLCYWGLIRLMLA